MTHSKTCTLVGLVLGLVLLATLICATISTVAWAIGMLVLFVLAPMWGITLGRSHLRGDERFRIRS